MLHMPRVVTVSMAAIFCLGATLVVHGQAAAAGALAMSSTVTLDGLKNQARPLLIFAPSAQDMRLMDQVGVLQANQKGAKERDLLAVAVPETGEVSVGKMLAPEEAAKARQRFHVGPGEFAVVLVGKDGGEKLRSAKPLAFKRLEDVIDGMPMRQEEMHGKRP